MPQAKPRHTARAIVAHDGHVLLMERWRVDKTGRHLHYFAIPGGGIEPGETPQAAVVREVFEETTIIIRPQRPLQTITDQNGNKHELIVCHYLSGQPRLSPTSPEARKSADTNRYLPRWVSASEFATLPLHKIYESARPAIHDILKQAANKDM